MNGRGRQGVWSIIRQHASEALQMHMFYEAHLLDITYTSQLHNLIPN